LTCITAVKQWLLLLIVQIHPHLVTCAVSASDSQLLSYGAKTHSVNRGYSESDRKTEYEMRTTADSRKENTTTLF